MLVQIYFRAVPEWANQLGTRRKDQWDPDVEMASLGLSNTLVDMDLLTTGASGALLTAQILWCHEKVLVASSYDLIWKGSLFAKRPTNV